MASADPAVEHEGFSFQFGDFTATGQLDYPAGARNAPVVVLIPGSSPEDLNADVGPSHIFLDISNDLTRRGYAVMRYNKRYVRGPGDVDYESYGTKLDLNGMRDDAERVLRAAEQDSHVDPRRVFLYGWSEGSTVAAALATTHRELAGTIFQAPVTVPWRVVFGYQTEFVELPYLQRYAVNGKLRPDELRRAYSGDGGLVARSALIYACVNAAGGDFTANPDYDLDHDGMLDIDLELRPGAEAFLDHWLAGNSIYAAGRALPTVTEQARELSGPVLVLQGTEDANVPPAGATALDAALTLAGNRDHTLRVFPGLGHSLGLAPDVVRDNFEPIDPSALDAIGQWLDAHVR
ncbi:alpha/beta hydrolase [Nocardia sp. NBC_01499]|uniref:alpha/beta hydrolase family protein n=1 Tax=Nocardia sp. NBC_01499 TaxID=2903597 RepID=UPI00386580F9